jgi:hypothetical protein
MRLAVLSESSADEAAIRIIVSGILGRDIQNIPFDSSLRVRGWPGVKNLLPVIIPRLHYNSEAEALAIVVDSDTSTIHHPSHENLEEVGDCRVCELHQAVRRQIIKLNPLPGKGTLKIAVGLAVPAIEAWYICLRDTHVNEATWARHLNGEQITYTKNSLKSAVYGTERPSLPLETERAMASAREIVDALDRVEELFPVGFSLFAQDVRSWM